MTKIREFIKENNLSFAEGNRNSTITKLIGYSQYLNMEKSELEIELSSEIENDTFIKNEVDRLWDYCKIKKYKKIWEKIETKSIYKY